MDGIQSSQWMRLMPRAEVGRAESSPISGTADGFQSLLLDSVDQVNRMQQQADRSAEALFTGGDVNTAEVLTSLQKADMSFRLMLQIRNKLVQAYQELKEIRI